MKYFSYLIWLCIILISGSSPLISQIPLSATASARDFFIENKGQWPEEVLYLAQLGGMNAWMTQTGITYDLYAFKKSENVIPKVLKEKSLKGKKKYVENTVAMRFKNSLKNPGAEGHEVQPGYYNYFIGRDESKWARNVKLFKEVSLLKVYEGIDVRIYLEDGSLRYDMILEAGADPEQIAMTFDGADGISVNKKGELVLKTSLGDLVQQKLLAYQERNGKQKKVECKFSLKNGEVKFVLGKYDKSLPLTIDPLVYSTYIGGTHWDYIRSIAVDKAGAAYVTGHTRSKNFPRTGGNSNDPRYLASDVIVSKLSPDGQTLEYSTFIGGWGYESGTAIAVTDDSTIYVTGHTDGIKSVYGSDFPVTPGAFDTTFSRNTIMNYNHNDENRYPYYDHSTYSGSSNEYDDYDDYDGFVLKLNKNGNQILYSTAIGGENSINFGYCIPRAIAVDRDGNAYITGSEAYRLQVSPNAFDTATLKPNSNGNRSSPGFITKLNSTGTNILYCTYLGGKDHVGYPEYRGYTNIPTAIAVDSQGNAFVTGVTTATDFPITPGAFSSTYGTGRITGTPPQIRRTHMEDIFVTKINTDASKILYSTFIGGDSADFATGIAVDKEGNAWITGCTYSSTTGLPASRFPVTPGAWDTVLNGAEDHTDAFLTKINKNGSALLYSTLIGRTSEEAALALAMDSSGNIFLTGRNTWPEFPVSDGVVEDKTFNGVEDAFVMKFAPTGGPPLYSSFLGGSSSEIGKSIAVDTMGGIYVAGTTKSLNFPVRNPVRAYDSSFNSDNPSFEDGFISKFQMNCLIAVDAGRDTSICLGQSITIGNELEGAGVKPYKYKWSPSAGLSSDTVAKPILTPGVSQKYTVTVNDKKGCLVSDDIFVKIIEPLNFSTNTPQGLDFGKLGSCVGEVERQFTITNKSGRKVEVTGYVLSNSAFTVVFPQASFSLEPNFQKIISVKFLPSSDGSYNDSLQLITAPCSEAFVVKLIGEKSQSLVKIDTNQYDFGKNYTCQTFVPRDTIFTIRNNGSGDILLKTPSIPAPFYIIQPALSDFPQTLKANDSLEVTVRLSPTTSTGISNVLLSIPYESVSCPLSYITIDFLFEQLQAAADISFKSIQLQDITGCDTYRDTTVTFTNTGTESVTIHSMDPASGLQLLGTLPLTLQPGETTTIAVRYAPVGSMTSVQAVFTYGPCDEKLTATLTGNRKGIAFEMPESITADTVVLCKAGSSQGSASITNQSGVEVTLMEDAVVTGPFTVTKLLKGSVFTNGTPRFFDYTFTPTGAGTFSGSITLQFDLCEFDTTILLKATAGEPQLTVSQATLAMGVVAMGGFKRDSVEITNTGTTAATITGLTGLSAPFSIVSPAPGFTLQPNESRFVTVRYDATSEGVFKDTLLAESNAPCEIFLKTEITAENQPFKSGRAQITIGSDTASSGNRVVIPLIMRSSQNLVQSNTQNYTATISFNKNLLKPIGSTSEGIVKDSRRIITISGTRGDTVGILKELEFTALLGDSACTDLVIENFVWTDGNATAITDNGQFCLSELCQSGGAIRLFTSGIGELMLWQNSPNPAGSHTEIQYNLVEPGMTSLVITDMLGKVIATLFHEEAKPGHYSLTVNTRDIPSGMYLYVLKNRTQTLTQTMQVAK